MIIQMCMRHISSYDMLLFGSYLNNEVRPQRIHEDDYLVMWSNTTLPNTLWIQGYGMMWFVNGWKFQRKTT